MNVGERVMRLLGRIGLSGRGSVTSTHETAHSPHDAALKVSVMRWQGEIAATLERLETESDVRDTSPGRSDGG